MNTGYTIYQVERTKSAAEQREVDRSNAQLAAVISRLRGALAAPLRGAGSAIARTACGTAPSGPGYGSSRFRGNAGSGRDEERAGRLPGRTGRPGQCGTEINPGAGESCSGSAGEVSAR